ncbi:hypothetical protein NC652_021282 [Populus alba x Populus x berolinensis]|nr:hypothetical protein NC652_021282 [Populus alba x Populus x berolinensis]
MFIHTSSLPLWHMKMMDICGTNRRQLIFDLPRKDKVSAGKWENLLLLKAIHRKSYFLR